MASHLKVKIWQAVLFFLFTIVILALALWAISASLPLQKRPVSTTMPTNLYIPAASRSNMQPPSDATFIHPLCYERFSEPIDSNQTSVFRYRPVYTPEQAKSTSGRNQDDQLPFCYQISQTIDNPTTGEPLARPISEWEQLNQNYRDHVSAEFSIVNTEIKPDKNQLLQTGKKISEKP